MFVVELVLLCCLLMFVVLRAGAQLKCTGCCAPAPCDVEHCKPAACGLLSFLSLLRAFFQMPQQRTIKCHINGQPHRLTGLTLLRVFLLATNKRCTRN